MSFARFALRHSAVMALKGATKAQQNVLDSDFTGFDIAADGTLRSDTDGLFILVYTDDSAVSEGSRLDLWSNGTINFVLEFGIGQAMTETNAETGESSIVGFNVQPTDTAMEVVLDVVGRQIATALHGPSPWAEIWRSFITGMEKLEHQRATLDDNGTRMAARQMKVSLNVISDPVYQAPLVDGSVWKRFEAAVAGTAAEEMTGHLMGTVSDDISIADVRSRFGLSNAAASALSTVTFEGDNAEISGWQTDDDPE